MTFLAGALADQLQHPHGGGGRLAGGLMRLANRRPNSLAIEALDVRGGEHVLELGFGPGEGVRALARLAPRGLVFGIDQSQAMLDQATSRNRREVARGRVRLSMRSFEDTGLPAASVDRILAVNVAYFWADAAAILRELDRVLRPGGRIGVYVTAARTMSRWAFAASGHHRLFDAQSLRAMLSEGPFPRAAVRVAPAALPLGVEGLVAVVDKPD